MIQGCGKPTYVICPPCFTLTMENCMSKRLSLIIVAVFDLAKGFVVVSDQLYSVGSIHIIAVMGFLVVFQETLA